MVDLEGEDQYDAILLSRWGLGTLTQTEAVKSCTLAGFDR